jgi:hypothetical protein
MPHNHLRRAQQTPANTLVSMTAKTRINNALGYALVARAGEDHAGGSGRDSDRCDPSLRVDVVSVVCFDRRAWRDTSVLMFRRFNRRNYINYERKTKK